MELQSQALPAQTAAGATSTTYLGTYDVGEGQGSGIIAIRITAPAGYTTVTGTAAPNNATFNVRQMRANVAVATIASLTLAVGVNLVAETPLVIPLIAGVTMQAGDTLDVQMVQNGTGLAIGAGLFIEADFG
jgi:hypothetical protein